MMKPRLEFTRSGGEGARPAVAGKKPYKADVMNTRLSLVGSGISDQHVAIRTSYCFNATRRSKCVRNIKGWGGCRGIGVDGMWGSLRERKLDLKSNKKSDKPSATSFTIKNSSFFLSFFVFLPPFMFWLPAEALSSLSSPLWELRLSLSHLPHFQSKRLRSP